MKKAAVLDHSASLWRQKPRRLTTEVEPCRWGELQTPTNSTTIEKHIIFTQEAEPIDQYCALTFHAIIMTDSSDLKVVC